MAQATVGDRRTYSFDAATVSNLIVAMSTVNAGNAAVANTTNLALVGVTVEPTDPNLLAAVQRSGDVQIVAGANITGGALVGSNALGQAVPVTATSSETVEQGVIGVARNTALSGNLVDVQLGIRVVTAAANV